MKKKPSTSKPPAAPEFNPDEVLARLLTLAAPPQDVIPPGYFTTKEWAVRLNMSNSRMAVLLRAGLDANEVEKRQLRVGGRSCIYYKFTG